MKTLTISTNAFNLTVYVNVGILGLHVSILIGSGLILLFAQSDATRRMAVLFLLLNLVVGVFLLFRGFTMSVDGESVKPEQPVKEVEEKPAPKASVKKVDKVESTSSKPIANKVEAPAPVPEPEPAPASAPAPAKTEEPPEAEAPEAEAPQEETSKQLEDFTESDWENLMGNLF